MRPTVFWATIAHQPSRSKHCQHSSSGHIPAPGKCCPQHNHRSTPGLQPDSTLQQLTQSSLLPTCWATLTSRSIGPQHLSRANAALTQLVHGCTAHYTGKLVTHPQQPALQPGNHCALNICRHSASMPWCKRALSWLHQLQLHSISVRPFSGPHTFTKESRHKHRHFLCHSVYKLRLSQNFPNISDTWPWHSRN